MNEGKRSEFCGTDGIVPLFPVAKPRITPSQLRQGDDEVGDDESAKIRPIKTGSQSIGVRKSQLINPGGQAETNKGPAG